MIDIANETLISLAAAARSMPAGRNGSPCSLGCILRWVLRGARAPSGDRVRLEAIRLGGRWVTSHEAIQRFAERLTPSLDGADTEVSWPRTPARRQRASERAAKKLDRIGI
jgi:hypothetical protein